MSDELSMHFFNRRIMLSRIYTIIIICMIVIARFFNILTSTKLLVFLTASLIVTYALDEAYVRFFSSKRNIVMLSYAKCIVYMTAFIVADFVAEIPYSIVVSMTFYGVFLIFETLLYDDVFVPRSLSFCIVYAILLSATLFVPIIGEAELAEFFISSLMVVVIFISILCVRQVTVDKEKIWNKKYNDVLFASEDVRKENLKLQEYQQRIEEVNSTINYQKIAMKEVNETLTTKNEETHALMEMMIEYNQDFDTNRDMRHLVESISRIKEASLCCFYIDTDVCLNDDPLFEYVSQINYSPERLKKDTAAVFEYMHKEALTEPLVICDNFDYKYPYFKRKGCCITAFPAFDKEQLYGVLVIVGDKYDFFYNGCEFYQSAIINFTSSLLSNRLYMATEDAAKKDGLTKIYNRIYFNQTHDRLVKETIANGGTMSILMMDIDHFKNVNDTYGHLAGDEAIKYVARADQAMARKYGAKAVRFGGEEFLLVMPGKTIDEAYAIARELHENIKSGIVTYEDMEIKLNVSVGVANYPETTDDPAQVLDRSDKAMYYAKTHGRGRIVIDGREEA